MKKVLFLVDNGPEFGADRYILMSGDYEGATDRAEMFRALANFFDCPEKALALSGTLAMQGSFGKERV